MPRVPIRPASSVSTGKRCSRAYGGTLPYRGARGWINVAGILCWRSSIRRRRCSGLAGGGTRRRDMLNRRAFLRHASQLGGSVALAASRLSWAQVRPTRTLVGALADDPLNFDPTQTVGPSGREATRALFDPLVNVDAAGRIVPGLATEWERPDARTYILHLRRGVRFHDGTTFEADAVKAHFD